MPFYIFISDFLKISVKFRKIWQTVNKYFTLVGAHFPGKSIGPLFGRGKRHKL